jgi:phage terminase large subunit-like protein
MKELYKIQTIGYDPAKAFGMVQAMQKEGFVMNVVRQGELTLTAPLDDIGERFLDGCVIFNENPLLKWYLSNVKLKRRSENATYLPTKQNKNRKIDGFAALLDAHTELLRQSSSIIPPEKKVSRVIEI